MPRRCRQVHLMEPTSDPDPEPGCDVCGALAEQRAQAYAVDPLAVPRSGLAEPGHCPGCALLKRQLSEVLQAESGLALWEILGDMKARKENGHPEDARPTQ